jgi:hypothetical protein
MGRRNASTKNETWQVAVVVAVVVITSLFLFFTPAPEKVFLRSSDGLVTFEGVARPASGVNLFVHDTVAVVDGIMLPLYEVTTQDGVVIKDGELTVWIDETDMSIKEAVLYRYNVTTFSWESLPTFFDLTTSSVSARVDVSGSLLIGLGMSVSE